MPKALIELSDRANRVVNMVKAEQGLRGKSEAIERIVVEYEEQIMERRFRPEFVKEIQRIRKGGYRKISHLDELLDDD